MKSSLTVLLLLAAAADAQIKIAVNRTTIESAPIFLAERAPGIQIVPVANGRLAMEQLLHGDVDAATGSETQMLLNSIAEPGIRIVMTLAEARYRIIAASPPASGASGLRGKKVALPSTLRLNTTCGRCCASQECSQTDVRFVNRSDMP